ncbi:NADH:flavin oxidoreductase [Neobacillus mesonae]|nr:NADH:flavin oxidoreductase [Neobacillus mesonae]
MVNKNILFDSVNIGSLTLKNRVGVAPMTRISATPNGFATEQMGKYYSSFAHGGFSLIITEGTYTDELYSQCYFDQVGIANNEQAESWRKVVDAVHEAGAKIVIQLEHAGALSQGNRFVKQTLAPSSIEPKGEPLEFYLGATSFPKPVEATKEDLMEVLDGFVSSAVRAKSVGFDGIEIHGANGYLLDEFLTEYTNHRADEYGGSAENRVRFLVEVSTAIRKAVGDDFTVGIRISQGKVNDYAHKWDGKEQDAKIIFESLGQAGLNYIHVTEYKAWEPAFSDIPGDNSYKTLAALAKEYGKLPVIANGHLEEPSRASELMIRGEADLITLGKGALANHDWVKKVRAGESLNDFDQEKVLRPNAKLKDFEV